MNYTKELQETVYFNLDMKDMYNIESLIKKEDYNGVRIYLEKLLDDKKMFSKGKIRNEYLSLYKKRKSVYSLFMNEYIKYLDANNNRRR